MSDQLPKLKMASTRTRKISLSAAAVALVLTTAFLVLHFSRKSPDSARAELLGFVPADATSVIFIDAAQLRASPFLATLYSWAPHPAEDPEYKQFILDTGFDYERDLSQVFIAISNHGAGSNTLVVAEGRFNRKKIEAYLGKTSPPAKPGAQAIFQIPARENAKPAFFAFLADHRVAISDSPDLSGILFAAAPAPGRAEWQTRFDRLSGSPFFAVIRQDPAVQNLAANQSPELAAFIAQLPWISLAARPDGDMLRVIAEGETITDTASSQLRDFLQGLELLARTGLDDAKLRQQMDPEERAAYIELLKGTEIEKVARGDSKSVRIVLPITTQFLKVAKIPSLGSAPSPAADPPPAASNKKLASRRDKPEKKK